MKRKIAGRKMSSKLKPPILLDESFSDSSEGEASEETIRIMIRDKVAENWLKKVDNANNCFKGMNDEQWDYIRKLLVGKTTNVPITMAEK